MLWVSVGRRGDKVREGHRAIADEGVCWVRVVTEPLEDTVVAKDSKLGVV